jgi:hypothetical protein
MFKDVAGEGPGGDETCSNMFMLDVAGATCAMGGESYVLDLAALTCTAYTIVVPLEGTFYMA